jgi:hypothetical protein
VTKEVYVATIMQMEVECASLTLIVTLIFFTLSIWNFEGGNLICIDVVVIWVVRVIDCLATKLQGRFLSHGVVNSLGVVYPQYWL